MITWFEITSTCILLFFGGLLLVCPGTLLKRTFQESAAGRAALSRFRIAGTLVLIAVVSAWFVLWISLKKG